jgi:hypothetical protein
VEPLPQVMFPSGFTMIKYMLYVFLVWY